MHSLFSTGFRFGPFRFEPRRRALFKHGQRIALRSKVADVLNVLLENGDRIVTKQTLRERVWGCDSVSDQSLFQAISDLRRALAPLEAVVTHPNQGYRLALPARLRRGPPRALAAGLVPLLVAVVALLGSATPKQQTAVSPGLTFLSPSMQAFASGVAQLNAGNAQRASILLSLALQEDAAFVEARLMLGEAYLAQGQVEDALVQGRQVLAANDARAKPDVHASVAAMSLISRAEGSAGSASRALHWAFEAARRAHSGGLVCTASQMDDRIDQLLAERLPSESSPRHAPPSAASRLAQSDSESERPPLPDYCSRMPVGVILPEARVSPASCHSQPLSARVAAILQTNKSMA